MTFRVRTDRRYIRHAYHSNRFVLVEIVAPPARQERPRPPVNLCFVVDRSGSMSGEKLALAKLAVESSVGRLRSDDRFAIVVYDNEVDVVFPSTPATADARRSAMARLAEIDARGSTDLGTGWLSGCRQVGEKLLLDGVNRCLLLTDGLANQGITDHDELVRHAGELRARGVSTTTFGVGADFDEVLLQEMSTAGGGNFYFIAGAAAIADYVTSEVGEALEAVAHDVTLQVTAAPKVQVESLSPFRFERRGGRTEITLGSLVAEQVLQVVLRLSFPLGELGRETVAQVGLSDRDGALEAVAARLAWQYADGQTNDVQERDREVDRAVARVFAARARQEATALNRQGAYPAAAAALSKVAKRIRGYAGSDAELRAVVAELERDASEVAAPMPAMALKQMHFSSYASARMRTVQGRVIRDR
ncbi:MAG TPA: VWA domain-containing protein [Candidatus Limnocylindria bacterium]|nr:VWA domain-containing protein [Candidatus Limnocylindria bacterium]